MKSQFPLFQSHLDLAHDYWRRLIKTGDTVIDATCGNGHDTLFLAEHALTVDAGEVIGMDIQGEAIQQTRERLNALAPAKMGRVRLIHGCHTLFPDTLGNESVRLIVYNLGYLPGGDKSRTTLAGTTFQSLESAMALIMKGGAVSITCYPGHDAGREELQKVLAFATKRDPNEWSCCHHQWLNKKDSPTLLLLQKTVSP